MVKKLLIPALTLLALSACSSSGGGGDASNSISFDNEVDARKVYNSIKIVCGEGDLNCPESTAGLSSLFHNSQKDLPWDASVCSATLIDHNKVLTNDHCIDRAVLDGSQSCAGRVKVMFPKTKTKEAQNFECQKIIKASPHISNNANRPDWVIIELKQNVSRKSAVIDYSGTPENIQVSGYPIHYSKTKEGFTGKALKNTCTTNMKHFFSNSYFHPQSAVVLASRCSYHSIKGNSGASYFGNNGIKFVGSFTIDAENKQKDVIYFGQKKPITTKFVGGSNLSCLPTNPQAQSPFCYFEQSPLFEDLLFQGRSLKTTIINKDSFNFPTSDANIKWSETSSQSIIYQAFLESFKTKYGKPRASGFEKTAIIPLEIIAAITLKRVQTLYPLSPTCVSKSAPAQFVNEMAFVRKTNTEAEIGNDGDFSINYLYDFLRMSLNKDSDEFYTTEFVPMDNQLKSEYLVHLNELNTLSNHCRITNPDDEMVIKNGNPCDSYSAKQKQLQEWVQKNTVPDYLINNEYIIARYGEDKTRLNIPICK